MSQKTQYVLGLDFGSDSGRALLADGYSGKEIASEVCYYPRWMKGLYSDPKKFQFRQHPLDYLEVLETIIKKLTTKHKDKVDNIVAISIDTTASTPIFVDEKLTPLSLKDKYKEDPDAMFILWKDHTAEKESNEINKLLQKGDINYAREMGNHYTPEAYWAKVLHILRNNEGIRKDGYFALELCDYLPSILTNCTNIKDLKCGHCIAGVKQLYSVDWNGFPPEQFFKDLDPLLLPIYKVIPKTNYTCDKVFGKLCKEWADKLGLKEGILVGVGNVDAHSGGVGGGCCYGTLVMNLGTSGCYMTVMPKKEMEGITIDGVWGQVDSSLLPGLIGYESGMSTCGDSLAWFRRLLMWNIDNVVCKCDLIDEETKKKLRKHAEDVLLKELTAELEKLTVDDKFPYASDWFNGRRSPKTNDALKSTITNLNVSTTAPEVFYSILEAICFATKAIIDHFKSNHVVIKKLIAIGGVAEKSPYAMQLMANTVQMDINLIDCSQAAAMGCVMHAATIAGIYPTIEAAQMSMSAPIIKIYKPDPKKKDFLMKRYKMYKEIEEFSEKNFK